MTLRWLTLGAVAAALTQTAILAWMIADRAMRIQNGREVLLQSEAVDPRDFFRGHYVRLNLTISDYPTKGLTIDPEIARGDTVYLELTELPDGFFAPISVSRIRPENAAGPVIRGTSQFRADNQGKRLRIGFPFTRYYAPRVRALELEDMNTERRLGVILSLADDGSGVITGLTLDGEKVYEEPLY